MLISIIIVLALLDYLIQLEGNTTLKLYGLINYSKALIFAYVALTTKFNLILYALFLSFLLYERLIYLLFSSTQRLAFGMTLSFLSFNPLPFFILSGKYPLLNMGIFDKVTGEVFKKVVVWGGENPKKFSGLVGAASAGVGLSAMMNGWDTYVDVFHLNEAKTNLDQYERQLAADKDLPCFSETHAKFTSWNNTVAKLEKSKWFR